MARSFLVLDIETVPDPDLVWDAAIGGFPPAPFHQVVALGVLWLDGTYEIQKLGAFGGEEDAPPDESKVLEEFADFIGKRHPTMVTFNGRRFDLPVLANRMLKHGVQFPAYYAGRSGGPDYRYRFSDEGHMDLADVLTDYGASRMPSLTALAQLVGMPGKMDVDGSKVQSMFEHGRYTEIRDYCLHDVVQTTFIFLRTELLRGRLTQDEYRTRAQSLWDVLERDPRVLPVLQQANKSLALLTD
ncbi:MAG: 3'-5' exonuclease [Deltaproteobacteria bacterium]|nr:3'-5' exonuclease [Deltaproteobacteria bacterium]MBW2628545.1 3'-5' exonuclease [Deltaproteobacteria bacterium]MBW2686036.1 3'-5' exonuclease [Deltaproteobacteria bacterium]